MSKTPNHSRLRLSEAGSLFVDHVKPTDAGRYTCRAVSGSGSNATTRLVAYNTSARLLVQTVGSDYVSVTWKGLETTITSAQYAVLYRERHDETSTASPATSGYFRAT